MPLNHTQILTEDCYYHVYNRAVGSEKLFLGNRDYEDFLRRVREYLIPYMDFFAYCLLPNHFHLLVRLHQDERDYSKCFSDFFNSYSKWFNTKYSRKGSLFISPFKRKEIVDNAYYTQVVYYIHRNPIHHRLAKEMSDWKYSSYNAILSEKPSLLCRGEILEWFNGREKFVEYHRLAKEDYLSGFDSL